MKIIISNAIGFLLIFSIISCTEEISEEVQNKEAVLNDEGNVSAANKSIRVVHKMDEKLSYFMHSKDTSADCELKSPGVNGFQAENYDNTSSTYTADCILDVQELDLYFNGVSFELQVDDQLCEYISYVPYSVWRFQPGSSNKVKYKIECDDTCEAVGAMASACGKVYDDYIPGTFTASNEITDNEQNFCTFDYATENEGSTWIGSYPNCDEGTITTHVYSYTGDPDPDADPLTDDKNCTLGQSLVLEYTKDELNCGGDRYNCVDGAVREDYDPKQFSYELTENPELESLSITKTYAKMFGDDNYRSNMKLANYSRICSETETIKTSTENGYFSSPGKGTLNGAQIEDIPFGYRRDSNGDVITAQTLPKTLVDSANEKTYLADNIFMGAGVTKPYYAFYCLDRAFDVKAQVRIFIREWDRKFTPTSSSYVVSSNLISDIALNEPLMDARFETQNGGNPWNDKADLDDFLEQDADSDEIYETKIFADNKCFESFDDFNPANFPGTDF